MQKMSITEFGRFLDKHRPTKFIFQQNGMSNGDCTVSYDHTYEHYHIGVSIPYNVLFLNGRGGSISFNYVSSVSVTKRSDGSYQAELVCRSPLLKEEVRHQILICC